MATYLDSSAIVKLAVREAESLALRRHLRRRQPLVSSGLARTEVHRALLPAGDEAVARGRAVLQRLNLVRGNDRILDADGALWPRELRSLDAIHLATAELCHDFPLATTDVRLRDAATLLGFKIFPPEENTAAN